MHTPFEVIDNMVIALKTRYLISFSTIVAVGICLLVSFFVFVACNNTYFIVYIDYFQT